VQENKVCDDQAKVELRLRLDGFENYDHIALQKIPSSEITFSSLRLGRCHDVRTIVVPCTSEFLVTLLRS